MIHPFHKVAVVLFFCIISFLSCAAFQPSKAVTFNNPWRQTPLHTHSKPPPRPVPLHLHSQRDEEVEQQREPPASLITSGIFLAIAVAYWYLLVFGATAKVNGLPIPDFIPMTPGWPPSDADLAPVLEDSRHFFYLADFLEGDLSSEISGAAPLRIAFFNIAESWVFGFLPVLIWDGRRLPLPVVIGTWLGALGLTNAFLAPYLSFRELSSKKDDVSSNNLLSGVVSKAFGTISLSVVAYALFQIGVVATSPDATAQWDEFRRLVVTDRTYLAFAVDLVLFSFFQAYLLSGREEPWTKIPFFGLIGYLLFIA